MKLGFGLYRHMLNETNYRFAQQCGATHIVAHLVDYFNQGDGQSPRDDQPVGGSGGWGFAGDPDKLWSAEELKQLKTDMAEHGLTLAAIENFDPAHWHDILLDGPKRAHQIEQIKTILRNLGEAGIGIMGYNFSLAGVANRVSGPFARGDAVSVGMGGEAALDQTPVPPGMVWNMIYDASENAHSMGDVSHDELWRRLERFLEDVLPTAEAAGVTLAAHPDDPPMPTIKQTPRLVYQPDMYQRVIDASSSDRNQLEFCLGSIAEMTEGDVYEATQQYSKQNKLAYIHFRNVRGKVPDYKETFVDEGDIDMLRVLRILKANNFAGILIPDHTPQMSCDAPWHAGMAYAMGYMKAAMRMVEQE